MGGPVPPFMATIKGVLPMFGLGRPGAGFAVLRLDLAGTPFDLRAFGQHQFQDFHVGRHRGAVKRRAVDRRAAAHRGGMQCADERLVHVRAEIEQRLHQTQGGQLSWDGWVAAGEPSCARMSVVASCMSTAKYKAPSLGSAPRSSNSLARSNRSLIMAIAVAVAPSALASFGSAPPLISASTTSAVSVPGGEHQSRKAA